jgi:hypothetical protein
MKMNLNEMEALYAFGCPNRKATIERLRWLLPLLPILRRRNCFICSPSS